MGGIILLISLSAVVLDDVMNRISISSYEGETVFLSYPRGQFDRLRVSEQNFQKFGRSIAKLGYLFSNLWFFKNINRLYSDDPTLYTKSGNLKLRGLWSRGFQVAKNSSICSGGLLYFDLSENLICVAIKKDLFIQNAFSRIKFITEDQYVFARHDPFFSRLILCRPKAPCEPVSSHNFNSIYSHLQNDPQWKDLEPASDSGYFVKPEEKIYKRLFLELMGSCDLQNPTPGKLDLAVLAEFFSRRSGIPMDLHRDLRACAGSSNDLSLNSAFDYVLNKRKNMHFGE
jgi:hypothetical protein